MNLQDYQIQNSTKCDCGYEFTIHNLTELKRINDSKFYGGNIKHVSETTCPQCSRKTLLLLKQVGQTYKVVDIAQKDRPIDSKQSKINNPVNTDTTEHSQIISKTINDDSNELICPICKRAFKSKQGLAIHTKTCGK